MMTALSRQLSRAVTLCSAALFVPLLIALATGRVFTLDDLGRYNIPMRYLYWQALHRGDSILWTPAVYAGYYLFGESQLGMAHPWHLFLYRFLPLALAVNIEMIGSYGVMFVGVVLLLKRAGLSRESRWFGAMVFTFSGYNLFHLIHLNIVAVVAHIPWLLLTAHILATAEERKTRARAFVALSLLFGSQILAGQIQHAWLGLVAVAAMCLYLLWTNAAATGIALVAGAVIVGSLVGGVQLLPLVDVARSSERTGWSLADSLSFSLVPLDVIQLWSPFTFHGRPTVEWIAIHEFIVYNGAFCTTAIAWVGLRRGELRRSRLVAAFLAFAAISLLLAFGKYAGLYTSLLGVPGLRWFRAPSRHLILFHLSLSIVAAMVFDDLISLARRGEQIAWRRLWPLAIAAALSIATAITASGLQGRQGLQFSGITETGPWVLLFLLVAVLFVATARGVSWALPLLVIVVAADQGYWGFQYVLSDPNPLQTIEALAARAPTPEDAESGDLLRSYRGYGLENMPVLRGFRVWPGYVGLTPALTLQPQNRDLVIERIVGAKWSLTQFPVVERIPDPAARARLLSTVKVSSNIAVDVQTIDILSEALVEATVDHLVGPPGSVRVVEDRPGRIVVETTTPGRQLLALTERFHPGWRITDEIIEVHPAEAALDAGPLRVNGDFLGCVVSGGRHRLTFVFAPTSFHYGLWTTAVGLTLVALIAIAAL